MSSIARTFGIARSVAMYYGMPLRGRRMRQFYAQFVPRGSLCFDIGAHLGNRVRCWLQLGARVVAIEPQADCVRLLRLLYGRDPRVEILALAVGRARGEGSLLVSERTPTVTTLSRDWVRAVRANPSFANVRWDGEQRVEIQTLQALIEHYGAPQFVKIDVEGYEAEVLAGLESPVRSLSFEYVAGTQAIAIACVERLAALGRYRYNWSPGESHRLASDEWIDADALRELLARLRPDAGSGDVYAMLDD
jgi:FkbM family methyltransferase